MLDASTIDAAFSTALRVASIALVGGYLAFALLGQWIEGSVSGAEALLGSVCVVVVMAVLILLWETTSVVVTLSAATAVGGTVFFLKKAGEEKLKRYIDEQEIARCKAAIQRDPKNGAAHSLLGDVYLRQKKFDDAIACYQEAVRLMPDSHQEKYKLRCAIREKERAQVKGKICLHCKAINSPLAGTCVGCGAELERFILIDFAAWLSKPESLKQIGRAAVWALPMVLGVLTFANMLNPPYHIVFYLILACIGLIALLRSLA